MSLGILQEIECHIIAWIETVVAMYLMIKMGCNGIEEFLLRHLRIEVIQILIDT